MTKTRKTGMKSSHYTTVVLPPCKVCGGESTGYHFGVITCEACKAFFRRSLVQKRKPKCKKNGELGKCHIDFTKSNNCSACRLSKCLKLGMSRESIRRGRFSLPLRTQAIVEANSLENKGYNSAMEESDASTPSSTISDSSDDSLSLVPFAESKSYNSYSPTRDAALGLVQSSEMECLIDALVSCQEVVYPSLKKHFLQPLNEIHDNVYKEFNLKQEIFEDVFGTSKKLSTEEYQTVFAETGLDLDDRLTQFDMYGRAMEESIVQYRNFVRLVPGFKTVSTDDASVLMKAAHLEVWFFGSHMLFNKELGVALCWDGSQNGTKEHMTRFFPEEWIDLNFEFADRLSKLKLSFEEIALIRAIVLTSADRCAVKDKGSVQSLQERFMECLRHYLTKTSTAPGRRLYKIFDSLLAVRSLNRMNITVNKQFLSQWEFIMQDFPLWKDMLSYDDC
ncbi:nuclear receptor subfamily 1 group D member 2-like [Ruditapes philippinarum]|uniref:nuclear receptor subfamily 1 group D member 2-like n=1 Tax=Ruditapes philippinarum TaxID=129788 RepID=UPI00295BDF55|nr:nuclear receptor subfamily 1 group D member 2-like [Ruditapes philippinarum]